MSSLRVVKFVESLGVPHEPRDPKKSYGYDGKTIATINTNSNVLHDAAHWIVCTSRRHRLAMKDFGLGMSPDSKFESKIKVDVPYAMKEELRASLLGIVFEAHLGLSWRKTAMEHGWRSDPHNLKSHGLEPISKWLLENVERLPHKSFDRVIKGIMKIRKEDEFRKGQVFHTVYRRPM